MVEGVTLTDPRLCKNYMACKSFGMTWRAKNTQCSGCGAEIGSLFMLTKLIDEYVQPLVGQARHKQVADIAAGWITAATKIRERLTKDGNDVDAQEVGMMMVCRLLLRIAELEQTVARSG